jgi:hypothetical protein
VIVTFQQFGGKSEEEERGRRTKENRLFSALKKHENMRISLGNTIYMLYIKSIWKTDT